MHALFAMVLVECAIHSEYLWKTFKLSFCDDLVFCLAHGLSIEDPIKHQVSDDGLLFIDKMLHEVAW